MRQMNFNHDWRRGERVDFTVIFTMTIGIVAGAILGATFLFFRPDWVIDRFSPKYVAAPAGQIYSVADRLTEDEWLVVGIAGETLDGELQTKTVAIPMGKGANGRARKEQRAHHGCFLNGVHVQRVVHVQERAGDNACVVAEEQAAEGGNHCQPREVAAALGARGLVLQQHCCLSDSLRDG